MQDFEGKSPYMDYRDTVPFMNLSGFIVRQPQVVDTVPAMSLQEHLHRKRCSSMINFRRLQYCFRVEAYKNGRI